jgi:hypothetical protein
MDERREIHHELARMAHRVRTITSDMECGRLTLDEAVRRVERAARRWRVVARPEAIRESPVGRHVLDELKRFHRRRMKIDPAFGKAYRRNRKVKTRILKDASRLEGLTDEHSLAFYRERLLIRWNHAPVLMEFDECRMWDELSEKLGCVKDRLADRLPEWSVMRHESAIRRRELVRRMRCIGAERDLAEARNEAKALMREWKSLPAGRAEQDARLWRIFHAGLEMAFAVAAEPSAPGEHKANPATVS